VLAGFCKKRCEDSTLKKFRLKKRCEGNTL
jgi:hypothetical protein